jgi:hypothetical protein
MAMGTRAVLTFSVNGVGPELPRREARGLRGGDWGASNDDCTRGLMTETERVTEYLMSVIPEHNVTKSETALLLVKHAS